MDFQQSEIQEKSVSYLRARDPSIIAWNRPGLANCRINLNDELIDLTSTTTTTASAEKQDENHVQVYLRIKGGIPFDTLYTIQDDLLICKIPEGSHAQRNTKDGEIVTKKYSFSKIFGPETKQIDVFNSIVKPKMLDFINGNNCTLMTYGASGSGKTFTIVGTAQEPGVIPRALEYLFRTIPQLSEKPLVKPLPNGNVIRLNEAGCREEIQNRNSLLNATLTILDKKHIRTYKAMQQRLSDEPAAILDDVYNVSLAIWVSFVEIYNEYLYDLLQPEPPRGKQRPKLRLGSSNGNTYVKDLTSVSVTSGLEAFQIMKYGIHNLNYASTSINSHSSRSHSIFTIKLVQASNVDDGVSISHFHFCDLAGSERLKKTMNVGDRLKESNNINTSLLVLGRCISGVRNAQKQNDQRLIPFRESKLTQLFQKALTGLESISMIVNMNPSREMFDESHHVLNFSAIAKDIIVEQEPRVIKTAKNNRFSMYMQKKQSAMGAIKEETNEDEIESLRNLISQLYTEMEQQKVEYEQNEEMTRISIITGYKEILKETNEYWEDKLKAAEKNIRSEYELKLNEMKSSYEIMMRESAKCTKVINLDDSSDERIDQLQSEIEDYKNVIKEQQKKITALQQEVTSLKFETKVESNGLQDKVKILMNENQLLKIKNIELEKTLADAEVAYKEIEEYVKRKDVRIQVLLAEKLELKEKNADLEAQLQQVYSVKNHEIDDSDEHKSKLISQDDKSGFYNDTALPHSTNNSDTSLKLCAVSNSNECENKENVPETNKLLPKNENFLEKRM